MPRRSKERKERDWLYTDLQVVRKSLIQKLDLDKTLDPEFKEGVCEFQSLVITCAEDEHWYTNIHSNTIKDHIKGKYTHYIQWLIDNDEIERNPKYRNDPNDPKKNYAKSYRLTKLAVGSSGLEYTTKENLIERYRSRKDKSKPTDIPSRHILKSLKEISVTTNLKAISDPTRRVLGLKYCKLVFSGVFNLNYGEDVNRLYHSVIRMVREARENLIYKPTQKPFWYGDIKTCFPNLLAKYATDGGERKKLISYLAGDFYQSIIDEAKLQCNRSELKERFGIWLSDEFHISTGREIHWFKSNFPNLHSFVINESSLSAKLQNDEANIVVNQLGTWASDNNIWFVSMHDGFLCLPEHGQLIKDKLLDLFESNVGHRPAVELKELK